MFIPDKTLQTEKSGEDFEFTLRGNTRLSDWNNGMSIRNRMNILYKELKNTLINMKFCIDDPPNK